MLAPLTFSALANFPCLVHGIFNRHGGISPSPYDSLNISYGGDDDPRRVKENRELIRQSLGVDILVSGQQVHGSQVHVITGKPLTDLEITGCDAFITNVAGVALLIQQADCQAIMLFDPQRQVAANIHCGWRGSVNNIIAATIRVMAEEFATDPGHLLAAISPSLGPCCAEFINYEQELPGHFHPFQVKPNYFDFWAISRCQLQETGVKPTNIFTTAICTVCDPNWFSYRREKKTGRFCSVIGVRSEKSGF
ncbi:MAG: peptidoglycan editing factor PgeF [Proteobacteria bacterium]|nr:peptidoglycan editing factor PgeF [Pseudomonadota bacterium]